MRRVVDQDWLRVARSAFRAKRRIPLNRDLWDEAVRAVESVRHLEPRMSDAQARGEVSKLYRELAMQEIRRPVSRGGGRARGPAPKKKSTSTRGRVPKITKAMIRPLAEQLIASSGNRARAADRAAYQVFKLKRGLGFVAPEHRSEALAEIDAWAKIRDYLLPLTIKDLEHLMRLSAAEKRQLKKKFNSMVRITHKEPASIQDVFKELFASIDNLAGRVRPRYR